MMKARHAILAGMILVVMGGAQAQANDENRSCFLQRTEVGTVKICASDNGGYEFGIKKFSDESDERDYGWDDDWSQKRRYYHSYYYPIVYEPVVVHHHSFVPPGHRKHHGHEHHDCHH